MNPPSKKPIFNYIRRFLIFNRRIMLFLTKKTLILFGRGNINGMCTFVCDGTLGYYDKNVDEFLRLRRLIHRCARPLNYTKWKFLHMRFRLLLEKNLMHMNRVIHIRTASDGASLSRQLETIIGIPVLSYMIWTY